MRECQCRVHANGLLERALRAGDVAGGTRDEPFGQRAAVRRGLEAAAIGDARERPIELCLIGERTRLIEVEHRLARAQLNREVELGDRVGKGAPRRERAGQILMRLERERKLVRQPAECRLRLARSSRLEAHEPVVERFHVRLVANYLALRISAAIPLA